MKTKKSRWILLLSIAAILLLYQFIGWRIPITLRMETLNLPQNYETVYPTKMWISDVYWWHIKAEKVIKCDIGYEAAKEYIETHNAKRVLKYIDIYPYGGMSDIAIYDSEFDDEFWERSDQDNYIVISYFRKI
ncbi:MAG: hypothetical protein HFI54_00105 [Lachnospiraceae bacterium]|nr:hypothetical protein [Lachnospiraceae bacterium]